MIYIQQLLQKTLDWKFVNKEFEKTVEHNLRNKKFYEWYSEVQKVAKQSIDGKKGKECNLLR